MTGWMEMTRAGALGIELAAPIGLAALGECVVQRAGNINLGIEGMMLSGCFCGAVLGIATGSALCTTIGAIAGGGLLALVFAILVTRFSLDEVVAGTALNLLALGGTAVLWRAQLDATHGVQKVAVFGRLSIPGLSDLSHVGPLLFAHQPMVYVCFAMAPLVAWWLFGTRSGLRLRACGEDPAAARAAGIDVERVRFAAILFGGAMAGAGGSVLLADASTFGEEMSAGRGFLALAVVIFGAHRPVLVLAAALLFGCAAAAQSFLQAMRFDASAEVKRMLPALFRSLPYVLSLLVLAGFAGRRRAPAGIGKR